MNLVERVAARGVGYELVVDCVADDGVDFAGEGFGGGGRDVEFAEEGGDDFLFFFCFGEEWLVKRVEVGLFGNRGGMTYSVRYHLDGR